jgi:poly(3-hydroxybutyrate) depolymerase
MTRQSIACGLFAAAVLMGQGRGPAGPLTANDQPDIQTLSRAVQTLRANTQPNATAAAEADKLAGEAAALLQNGQTGEARRRLAHAQALMTGKSWDARDECQWSLVLRPHGFVVEQSHPMMLELSQFYAAAYRPAGGLRLHVALKTAEKESKVAREIGSFDVPLRDLAAEPFLFQADLSGLPDGSYRLFSEVLDGTSPLVSMLEPVALADGIESRHAEVERRLAKIQGHDSAKATVRWPFDMARVVNLGIRKLETTDFGLPEQGLQVFDFAKELKDSAEVLKVLEGGKDPLLRAKGDHERHYWFEEAGEIMPYRVYVPSTWDGKKQLPMMLVMHGTTRDHNFYFDRDGGILAKLAEKSGFIVATTMGYRPNAGYNASAINALSGTASSGAGRGTGRGGFAPNAAQRRQAELSEKDAMNTLDLVVKEYNPDPSRIYLFGHSAGGTGGWYIASKYPERFSGAALSAFGTQPQNVPWERLKGLPILVIVGSKDSPRTVETVRTMAKVVKEKGFDTQFLEVPEATHDTIVGLALPTVYEFFSKHARGRQPVVASGSRE